MSSHNSSDACVSEAISSAEAILGRDHDSSCCDGRIILSAQYVQESRGKKDLVQRLRQVVQVLRDNESVEPDSENFPALAALCQALLSYLPHRDKEVRLYTVAACMELFTVYAPDAPWSTQEVLEIFRQTIRQLANLAHTTNHNSPHFNDYERILDLLAQVKIAVILVEMTKDDDCREEALLVLTDLFKTLLQSVRNEHPPQVPELVQQTLCGCLEEFHDGIMLPVPLLDELLMCIGQGSCVLVVNPAKTIHKNIPLLEQANPSFRVASSVIRSSVERLATPIAALLNGLLNTDSRLMEESSISTQPIKELGKPATQDQDMSADVFNIIYELHRVAPMILTTVIGTLANFLESAQHQQRLWVVQLLGRLFQQQPKFTQQFRACFRQWLERGKDKSTEIRKIMVKHLVHQILVCKSEYSSISQEVQAALQGILVEDPDPEVRLACIHGICDQAYAHPSLISVDLLLCVGRKTGTKQKQERKDALTGLVQTYFQHYMLQRLSKVVQGGENVSIQVVQEALDDAQLLQSPQDSYRVKFEWIPNRVFEAASFQDDLDLTMRVWQSMDDLLLGSDLSLKRKLTPTARAVGLALIVENLEENALAWLGGMLRDRARLQQKVVEYLSARALIRDHPFGSEEHLTADANALDILEEVAAFVSVSTGAAGERNPMLERFHGIRDKHIFRILASIASPTHSTKSRLRAIEEPAKKLNDYGDALVKFVRVLVRKCAMGDFINQEIVHRSITLAQNCGLQEDWGSCRKFLNCVQLAAEHFPDVCAREKCFESLRELFAKCRSSKQKGLGDIVTSLSAILAKAASKRVPGKSSLDSSLYKELLRLCRDGTPEQARHAVQTLTAMIHTASDDTSGSFKSLLNSLASNSILSVSAFSERIVTAFAALSELTEAAPRAMWSKRGQQAVQFALESVLLGRENSGSDKESSDGSSDDENRFASKDPRSSTTPQCRLNLKDKHLSPSGQQAVLDNKDLTLTCRKLCACIEFLTVYTRATCFEIKKSQSQGDNAITSQNSDGTEHIFEAICKVLRDEGLPPSNRDRQDCNLRHDRAALRQCAAISLLRLCDPRLGLDIQHLSISRWHVLANVFLDDERVVREKVMAELGLMLTGHGKYGRSCGFGMAMPPRQKFLSLVVLCPDGENANGIGNAASVGKHANHAKKNALSCVNSMRVKFEVEAEQARANGPAAEQRFERGGMKFSLMPEYVVPYAFHLLAFRKETPMGTLLMGATGNYAGSSDDEASVAVSNEIQHRVLRKRLRWLFDPLVQSLGDSADNISFLISMSAKLSRFAPTGLSLTKPGDLKASARLQAVCESSRSVLMTLYAKKDINLAPFPGQILIPAMLYKKSPTRALAIQSSAPAFSRLSMKRSKPISRRSSPAASGSDNSVNDEPETQNSLDSIGNTSASRQQAANDDSLKTRAGMKRRPSPAEILGEVNHVRFSPHFSLRLTPVEATFGELSPIERNLSTTGIHGDLVDSGEKTRGSTPPSAVHLMTFGTAMSTTNVPLSNSVTQSPASKTSERTNNIGSTRKSLRLSNMNLANQASLESDEAVGEGRLHGKILIERRPTKTNTQTGTVPEQIKIVRHRTPQPDCRANCQSRKRKSPKNDDNMDFAESGHISKIASKGAASKNKENTCQPAA